MFKFKNFFLTKEGLMAWFVVALVLAVFALLNKSSLLLLR